MSRDDIVLNFTSNPDDGEDTADIDEFLDVSIEKAESLDKAENMTEFNLAVDYFLKGKDCQILFYQ